MRNIGMATLMLAAASMPANSKTVEEILELIWAGMAESYSNYYDATQPGGYASFYPKISDREVALVVETMIQQQSYVCARAIGMEGRGGFERGRYAQVECSGDGGPFFYRLELWQDRNSYTVRPWSQLLDD